MLQDKLTVTLTNDSWQFFRLNRLKDIF